MEIKQISSPAPVAHHRRLYQTVLLSVGLLCIVAAAQVWVFTAGWKGFPEYTNKYMRLARGFLHGQVSLLEKPSAKLLAVKDPYDPVQSNPFRDPYLHDVALFHGKYFLYWGPVPAGFITLVSWIIRDPMPDMGDQYFVLAFMFGTAVLATSLMLQIRSVFFPDLSNWSIAPPLLSLGLGTPMLFTLARSGVYEAAICGGQFFLMAGLCCALAGIARVRPRLLALTGIFWTLSIGCRISLLPAIGMMTLIALWRIWHVSRMQNSPISPWKTATALCLPLAVGGVLYAWYNFIRFQSLTEFGTTYLLAGAEAHRLGSPDFFTLGHLIPNLYRYLFDAPKWQRQFPFALADHDNKYLIAFFHLNKDYAMEPLTGLAWSQPFLIFSLVSLPWVFATTPAPAISDTLANDRSLRAWLVASLLSAALIGIAPPLALVLSTMRYLMDCAPAAAVLACIGFWYALRGVRDRPVLRGAFIAAVILIVLAEIVLGLLMGVSGYLEHFKLHNSQLYEVMVRRFSF